MRAGGAGGGRTFARARGTADAAEADAAEAARGPGANVGRPEEAVGARGNWGESSGRPRTAPRANESIEGEVFRPRERLKTNADFDRVKRDGRTYNGAHLRIKAVDNASHEGATCTRIGIVVPKKRVRRAVDRNLIKRRVRHVFRTNKDKWPPRVDIIVFAGDTALEAGFEGVRDDMFAWSLDYVSRAEQSQRRRAHGDAKRRRGEKFGATTAAESPPARPRAAARPPTPSEKPSV